MSDSRLDHLGNLSSCHDFPFGCADNLSNCLESIFQLRRLDSSVSLDYLSDWMYKLPDWMFKNVWISEMCIQIFRSFLLLYIFASKAPTRSASRAAPKDEHGDVTSCCSMVYTVQTSYIPLFFPRIFEKIF